MLMVKKLIDVKFLNYIVMAKYSLIGIDGNAYSVMGYTKKCMKEVGMSQEEIDDYIKDATSGDYTHLLCASMDMVDLCNEYNYIDQYKEEDV